MPEAGAAPATVSGEPLPTMPLAKPDIMADDSSNVAGQPKAKELLENKAKIAASKNLITIQVL